MASYVSFDNLTYYDTKLKAYMATKDAEVLARAGVTIEQATTPTAGSAITYVVYQNYSETGNPTTKTKVEIGKIEIPLDHEVESGSLVTTAATATDAAKAEIVMVMANTTDATTTSGKKEVRVDISAVAGDIADVVERVDALEDTHGTKTVGTETVLKTVSEQITEEAKSAEYKAETSVGAGDGETIGAALTRFEDDLTYKGVATAQPTSPKKGDLYNFNIAETSTGAGDEVKGWKFYDGAAWQSLDDPTLAARVGVLETQVGKDKTVTAYESKTDLVDIVNILTGANTVDGSVLKAIKDNAGNATSNVKGVDKYEEIANPGTYITVAAYEALTDTDKALYQVVEKDLTINEAIKDAKDAATAGSVVTVEKLATAETGYAASYVVKQNGTEVGAKINIPKDFLVKSGTLETCATVDTPVTGLAVGDKYLDFVVNTKDNDETAQHIYLPVNDLFDSYTSGSVATDAIVVTVDNTTNKITAAITDATISRAKVDADFEADLKAIEDAIGYVDPDATTLVLQSVSDTIEKEAKDAIYKAEVAESAPGAGDGQAAVTIAEAIKALEDSASDTNGAFVMKGDVADLTALNAVADPKKGDAYYVTDVKSLYIRTATAWKKLAVDGDFTVGNGALNKSVDIKSYIDSRIFIGEQSAVDAALAAGTIDDSTFIIVTDSTAEGLSPIEDSDIDDLFA